MIILLASHLLNLKRNLFQIGLKLAKEIAQIHFGNGDISLAQEAMETAFKKYPACVTPAHVNLMLDVLMSLERHEACISTLIDYMQVELHPSVIFITLC